VTVVDWERYQKCRVCSACIGEPCVKLSGSVKGLGLAQAKPHSTRKLRAAAARAAGDR
jgi:hypothetical protein